VQLAGITTDLFEKDDALGTIMRHASDHNAGVLGVVSMNLDHLHHFGSGRSLARNQGRAIISSSRAGQVRWLALLDGAPLVRRAGELTGRPWPRLAGSDLIEPILDEAERLDLRVGFLGGSPQTHEELKPVLARRWPRLRVNGYWAPSRTTFDDPDLATQLAERIRKARVDILVVCLGKPRQERWIAEHGAASGARVCLAFGAVVDFLAGRVHRAPEWVSEHGMEWAWRLAIEPRRLARRYLIQGPPSYHALQTDSFVLLPTTYFVTPYHESTQPLTAPIGVFVPQDALADVTVVTVTHNSGHHVDPLIESLRHEAHEQQIRLVVVDNASTDDTLARLSAHPDILVVPTGRNLGYAGGLNAARAHVGDAAAVLILNPDLTVEPGSIRALRERLLREKVGVSVPQLLEPDGRVYPSLRREPSISRAIGDALFGERLSRRPGWLSEIDFDPRNYRHPHRVEWATGAALLISAEVWQQVGPWDERYFLYSEEVDYLRRVRTAGWEVWYEPLATMQHSRGGSGSSDELEALQQVNRVRYQEAVHGRAGAVVFRSVVIASSLLRASQGRHRAALHYLVNRKKWEQLPHAIGAQVEST
jgi:exopolysaccharide biosynthesis WecB/TagA/CpsF family protein